MAFLYYTPGRSPQYFQPQFYSVPPPSANAAYVRPAAQDPSHEPRKLHKKQHRWSFGGYAQQPQGYPLTPPPTPMNPRRVHWEADLLWAPTSLRYPDLHPVLAVDSTRVNFDVRVPPEKGIVPAAYRRFWSISAVRRPTMHMRLVSQDHPWVFEIDFRSLASRGTPHYVTCGDVWTALTTGLSQPMTDVEWSLLARDSRPEQIQRKRSMMETVALRKYEHGKYLRRVDWLGRNVVFQGLVRDDKFTREVLLPGRDACPETWVVKFSAVTT